MGNGVLPNKIDLGDGRYVSVDADGLDDDLRAALTRDLGGLSVSLGDGDEGEPGGLYIDVGLPRERDDPADLLIVPLALLVIGWADDCTPGPGAPPEAWDDLRVIAVHLRKLADEVESRIP